jgi:hypothetical protein
MFSCDLLLLFDAGDTGQPVPGSIELRGWTACARLEKTRRRGERLRRGEVG